MFSLVSVISVDLRMMLRCLVLLTLFLAHASHAVTLDAHTRFRIIDQDIAYRIDAQDNLSPQQVLREADALIPHQQKTALNLGHQDGAVWVKTRLAITATDNEPTTWFVEIAYANLARADLYVQRSNGDMEHHRSGYGVPVSLQSVPHHHFVFPVHLLPGEEVTLLFNVKRKGGSIQVPLQVWDRWTLMHDEIRNNYIYGAFFGVMYAMLLYNLFLFVTMRLPSQFYYIVYLACTILTFHSLTGYGHLILWPETGEYSGLVSSMGASACVTLALLFLRSFVHTQQLLPRVDKALIALACVGPIIIVLQWFDLDRVLSAPSSVYAAASSIVAGTVAWVCMQKGSRPAIFFLLGWVCLLLGVVAFSLSLLGVLPANAFTQNSLAFGAVIEVILLSLGLADRFNTERRERYSALAEKHEALVRLKDTEHQLMYRALHSGTTGLPNRNLMRESLRQLIAQEKETETRFSVVLVSFKNFHEFNKTLGHQNGDAILRVLSQRMSSLVSENENAHPVESSGNQAQYVATIEGVIFGCIVKLIDKNATLDFASHLLKGLEQPFSFQGMSLQMDAQVGISQYPRHGDSADHLLRSAQIALELAGNHPEQLTIYSQDEDPYSAKRLTLLSDLRHAIESDLLELYLQPQLDLSGSRVTGAEVLIRWKHPQHGFIPPDQFIPLAERTGVIQPLTYWVFQKAFSHLQKLNELGHELTLSVNISARNLQDPAFQDRVLIAAEQHSISPQQIVMELTETAMMLNETSGASILYELDRAGFGLAIDDFGTGYSSLAYLKRLPVQEIKIDRTFIKDMAQQQDDQVIVTTTLQMGHNLGLRVVAEGIEDETTLNFLREAGCDLAQGYFIAKPMPFADFVDWLNKKNVAPSRHAASL